MAVSSDVAVIQTDTAWKPSTKYERRRITCACFNLESILVCCAGDRLLLPYSHKLAKREPVAQAARRALQPLLSCSAEEIAAIVDKNHYSIGDSYTRHLLAPMAPSALEALIGGGNAFWLDVMSEAVEDKQRWHFVEDRRMARRLRTITLARRAGRQAHLHPALRAACDEATA